MLDLLLELKLELQRLGLWEELPPSEQALASAAPFSVDTLTPPQWLQWVFFVRVQQLLAANLALPKGASVAAYFEYWAAGQSEDLSVLLNIVREIDATLNAV